MTEVAGAAAAADILAGDTRPGSAARVEAAEARHACANCGADLKGAYCHDCGQRGHLHTKLWNLVEEFAEGVAHFDGRMWRTLPLLVFRPGTLSRRWSEGRRARYVPPLHVFLFAVFLLFLLPNFTGRQLVGLPDVSSEAAREAAADIRAERGQGALADINLDGLLDDRWKKVKENSQYYSYKIETLSYKLSFMVVPISMGILALLLAFKRGYTLYDHGVVSLYGVGFLVLALAVVTALPVPAAKIVVRVMMVAAPVHAIVHLHGAYRLSWPGAILRGLLLGALSLVGFGLFLMGVFMLGIFG